MTSSGNGSRTTRLFHPQALPGIIKGSTIRRQDLHRPLERARHVAAQRRNGVGAYISYITAPAISREQAQHETLEGPAINSHSAGVRPSVPRSVPALD
jgi:hypothetical protein